MYYPVRREVVREAQAERMQSDREVAFPFGFDADGRTRTYTSLSAKLSARVTQLLLTAKGERRMRPTYGTDIRKLVFHAMSAEEIQALLITDANLTDVLRTYAPEVTAIDVEVRILDHREGVVQLDFILRSSGADMGSYRASAVLS